MIEKFAKLTAVCSCKCVQEAQYPIFEVLTAVAMDINVFWNVTAYNVFYSEDGVSNFLRNFGKDRLYISSDPER
jgi:hypothetical protein